MKPPAVRLIVRPLPDPHLEALGWPVIDPLTERWWLPILGPSSLLLARRLVRDLDGTAEYICDAADMATRVGLGAGRLETGSQLGRALLRLGRYGFAFAKLHHDGFGPEWRVAIRSHVPPPRRSWVERYPLADQPDLFLILDEWAKTSWAKGCPPSDSALS